VVVILLVIIAYLAMKIRRKKQSERKDLAAPPQALEAEKYQDNAQAYQRTPVELYEENAPVEIGENSNGVTEWQGASGVNRPLRCSRHGTPSSILRQN
jgi:hypothetical protein